LAYSVLNKLCLCAYPVRAASPLAPRASLPRSRHITFVHQHSAAQNSAPVNGCAANATTLAADKRDGRHSASAVSTAPPFIFLPCNSTLHRAFWLLYSLRISFLATCACAYCSPFPALFSPTSTGWLLDFAAARATNARVPHPHRACHSVPTSHGTCNLPPPSWLPLPHHGAHFALPPLEHHRRRLHHNRCHHRLHSATLHRGQATWILVAARTILAAWRGRDGRGAGRRRKERAGHEPDVLSAGGRRHHAASLRHHRGYLTYLAINSPVAGYRPS